MYISLFRIKEGGGHLTVNCEHSCSIGCKLEMKWCSELLTQGGRELSAAVAECRLPALLPLLPHYGQQIANPEPARSHTQTEILIKDTFTGKHLLYFLVLGRT